MRILHLGKFFPPHPGGIERFVADLAAAQAAQGMAVRVLAHAEPGTRHSEHLQRDGVAVDLAACHGHLIYAPVSPAFPRLLARAIREFRPDVLHIHVPNTSAFWALLLPAARRLPWIVHWHADIPLDSRRRALRLAYRVYRPWEQALLRRARAIIATSQAYADSSAALAPWRDKVRVVALGLSPSSAALRATTSPARGEVENCEPLSPRGRGDGERGQTPWPVPSLRLLAVGRLSYFKGFDVLLRALAQVPQASLALIGDGECGAALRALATQLGIDARVQFIGRLDMDAAGAARLGAAYAQADVFCLPSTERAESFGMVLLEAMRAGKPTIASDIPGSGVGFVVRDGETGLLVRPGDADALAAAIRRLASDAGLRERLGAAGRERFQREFTLERIAPQIADLYLKSAVRTTAS
ncbi:MAG: glycosyltransferase [Proteobacteria bacterium]|nr:glycosyltransferase [Pseudomonadota bacterium]